MAAAAATKTAAGEAPPALSASGDLCETLIARYAKSPAPQHRHLVATAAAMRSILLDEALPLIPAAYFAAAISTIQNAGDGGGDPAATSALVAFLSVVLPAVPRPALTPEKASEAAGVLNGLLRSGGDGLPASTLQSLVKSVGALVKVGNLEDWGVVKPPLKTLVSFSTDKRPKVRKVAQLGIEDLFRSIQDSKVRKKSSKTMLHFFDECMPKAIELAAVVLEADADVDSLSKSDHVEVFHMLNTVKLVCPLLTDKIQSKLLLRLNELLSSHYSPVTRHAFNVLEMLCESLEAESSLPGLEELLTFLTPYISSRKKVPQDSILCATKLLKCVLRKVHLLERSLWFRNLWHVLDAVAGQLNSGTDVAEQASDILVEIVNSIDINAISKAATHSSSCHSESCPEWKVIEIICFRTDNILDKADAILGKHVLAVISHLFLSLGGTSYLFMREIFIKLSIRETSAKEGSMPDAIREHLHDCIGSAIAAMGAEEVLGLIPITFHPHELTLSNMWLIPLLRKCVRGASLKYFMDHIVPLANSIKEASVKVKKPHVLHNLQSSYDGLWALLPAFCRYPTDVGQSFEAFARLIVSVLKKSPLLCATISMGLLELVNQNKRILNGNITEGDTIPSFYSKKVASKNIKIITGNSVCLLEVLRDIMFDSTLEDRGYLKEAMGCLASITDSSKVKKFFITSLKKYELEDCIIESEKFSSPVCESSEKECGNETSSKTKVTQQRCILLEFVSSLVMGADETLVNMLFDYVKATVRAADNVGQAEAYSALGRIFQEHPWFYSSQFDELMTLLLNVKPNDDEISLKNRLSCFRFLLVRILKGNADDTSEKAFLILNEIILTVKSAKRGAREAAYDSLRMAVSDLKRSKHEDSEECLQRLFSMILAYLSGSSPHIMSGAVSALSLLIYNDPGLCFAIPDLMSSVFILLKSKALEVVKAVMGFMKVLVSCLPVKDLQKYVTEIVDRVLPWSDVSKNHIRAKVRIIMEIIIRKCGLKVVELIAPEKYWGFIRTVVEERQSSNGLKGVDTSEPTSKPVESSMKWKNKRKHVQMASNSGNNSEVLNIVGKDKKRKLLEDRVSDTSKRKKRKLVGNNGIERGAGGIKGKKRGSSNKMPNGGKVDDRRKHHLKRHANIGRLAGSAKPHKYSFEKPRKRSKVQLRKT